MSQCHLVLCLERVVQMLFHSLEESNMRREIFYIAIQFSIHVMNANVNIFMHQVVSMIDILFGHFGAKVFIANPPLSQVNQLRD